MITQERPAFYTNERYSEYCGLSTDNKTTIEAYNGDEFYEINSGKLYKYNADAATWVEQLMSGDGDGDFKADGSIPMIGNLYMNGNAIMGVKSISNTNSGMAIESEVSMNNHKITDVLTPTEENDVATKEYVDGYSMPKTGGTMTGNLYIAPENTSSIIMATMASGAVVQFKDDENTYINTSIDTPSSVIRISSGASQTPVILRGIGEPSIETDAVNKKYIEDTYGTMSGATFSFNGVTRVQNVGGVGSDHDAANKYYVDRHTKYIEQFVTAVVVEAKSTASAEVSITLPATYDDTTHDFVASVCATTGIALLCSVIKKQVVSSSGGSWLRVTYLAYNPTDTTLTENLQIQVLCISK